MSPASVRSRISVFLHEGFRSVGAVRLAGASIGGNLEMDEAEVGGADDYGDALVAHGVSVGGDVFLHQGFEAVGAVRLAGAAVDGQLSLCGAVVGGTDREGNSVVADGLRVGNDVFLHEGFRSVGAVRLAGASIGGNLEMDGATIDGPNVDGDAVAAARLHVAGDALLRDGFRAAGAIRLSHARIEGQLWLAPTDSTSLALVGARCTEYADSEESWPPAGALAMRGFRYGTLATTATWQVRLAWVRRQGYVDWSPDPYEQLAGFYTSIGDENAFRQVRMAKHGDELRHLKLTRRRETTTYRFWRRPFGWLLGYGYRRQRAGWLLVATLVVASFLFRQAEVDGGMVTTEPAAAQGCGPSHACFNSVIYSADVVLPIVDFGQDSAWRPVRTDEWGPMWIWARWALVALGWLLASMFVAAFTGLVPLT